MDLRDIARPGSRGIVSKIAGWKVVVKCAERQETNKERGMMVMMMMIEREMLGSHASPRVFSGTKGKVSMMNIHSQNPFYHSQASDTRLNTARYIHTQTHTILWFGYKVKIGIHTNLEKVSLPLCFLLPTHFNLLLVF